MIRSMKATIGILVAGLALAFAATANAGEDQLVLTPDRDLTPGHYRLLLAAESGLLSTDGETLDDAWEEEFDRRLAAWEAESVLLNQTDLYGHEPSPVPR